MQHLRRAFRLDFGRTRWEQWGHLGTAANITPVKMAVNIIQTESTDPNLPPLIIMHGLFGSKHNWRSISKALEKKCKRKIYNVDARNHGDSPHHPEHGSPNMAADIVYLMKEENLKRVSVLGHSMGGRTMMYFALNYPDLVEKAIIVDISPVSVPGDFGSMLNIFVAMKNIHVSPTTSMAEGRLIVRDQIKEAVGDMETVDFIMLNLKKTPSGEFTWAANVDSLMNNFNRLRDPQDFKKSPFTGPMLFIAGKKSGFINPNDWPKITQIFPNAKIEWLDSGHLVHFEQPAKFVELVDNFLKT